MARHWVVKKNKQPEWIIAAIYSAALGLAAIGAAIAYSHMNSR